MKINELFYEYDYFGVNNELRDGITLTPYESKTLLHEDLEVVKNLIKDSLNAIESKKENDIVIIFYTTTDGDTSTEMWTYILEQWQPLIENEILSNKFEMLYQSEMFVYRRDEILYNENKVVESWNDIIKNFKSFQEIDNLEPSRVLQYYRSFFHWYYWPEEGLFAPSKFLGYKNSTIGSYDSSGTGGVTQKVLAKYFNKLDRTSEEFKKLFTELSQISKNNFGKDLNDKVLNGTGGIYVPKQ